MKSFTDERVENYLYATLPERGPILQEMERQAQARDIPIVGPAVGRLFYQYARLINAKTVFELGSAIGYSTIWWAKAVGKGGEVHYTDGSRKNADEARGYFEQIERKGGMIDALESGFFRREIADAAFAYQRDVDAKRKLIVGVNDPAMSADVMEQTWGVFFPQAELTILPDAGHYPMFECPVVLATSIEEFLVAIRKR